MWHIPLSVSAWGAARAFCFGWANAVSLIVLRWTPPLGFV